MVDEPEVKEEVPEGQPDEGEIVEQAAKAKQKEADWKKEFQELKAAVEERNAEIAALHSRLEAALRPPPGGRSRPIPEEEDIGFEPLREEDFEDPKVARSLNALGRMSAVNAKVLRELQDSVNSAATQTQVQQARQARQEFEEYVGDVIGEHTVFETLGPLKNSLVGRVEMDLQGDPKVNRDNWKHKARARIAQYADEYKDHLLAQRAEEAAKRLKGKPPIVPPSAGGGTEPAVEKEKTKGPRQFQSDEERRKAMSEWLKANAKEYGLA